MARATQGFGNDKKWLCVRKKIPVSMHWEGTLPHVLGPAVLSLPGAVSKGGWELPEDSLSPEHGPSPYS